MQWWHRLCLCFALRFYFALAYYVLPQIAFTFGSCFGTSPLVDFPLVSPCRSKKALAFLDCRAVALSDRNFKSSFVQAQQLLIIFHCFHRAGPRKLWLSWTVGLSPYQAEILKAALCKHSSFENFCLARLVAYAHYIPSLSVLQL
jgi:hypothetical protein